MLIVRPRLAFIGLVAAAIVGQLFVGIRPTSAQVLEQLRQDVRFGEPTAPAAPSNNSSSNNNNSNSSASSPDSLDTSDSTDESPLLVAGLCVIAAPYWLPAMACGDNLAKGYFLRYPYWDDMPGTMYPIDPQGPRHRSWAGEAAFDYANDLDDLSRFGGHLRISTVSHVDVETNYNWFEESSPTVRDHLSMGDVDLLFRFAETEKWQFRSGFGANWFADKQGVNAGFNFRYGVEWFPKRPWTAKALIDLGELGKSDLIHVRSTVGVDLQRWELFTGYDYRKIGDVHIDGPLVGLQMRF